MSSAMTITRSSAHSPTFPSLHIRHNSLSNPSSLYLSHSSFSNLSVVSPTSQFILQPFFRFSYVTSSSLNSPGQPPTQSSFSNLSVTTQSPTLPLLYLRHSSFSNPSFASPTSQALHSIHLASRSWTSL